MDPEQFDALLGTIMEAAKLIAEAIGRPGTNDGREVVGHVSNVLEGIIDISECTERLIDEMRLNTDALQSIAGELLRMSGDQHSK